MQSAINLFRLLALLGLGAFTSPTGAQTVPVPRAPAKDAKPLNREPIDFSVRLGELRFDGMPYSVVLFTRGDGRIVIQPPAPWIASGSSSEFVLTTSTYPQSRITLRLSSLSPPAAFDETWIATMQERVLGSFPKDSNRTVRDKRASPLVMNRWQSFELSVNFDQSGGKFVRGYIFILTPQGELLELISGARVQDYQAVRSAAVLTAGSWQEMDARTYASMRTDRDTNAPTPRPTPVSRPGAPSSAPR